MKKVVFLFLVLAAAMAAGVVCWRLWAGRLHAPAHEPTSRTRFLDPYTRVYQTDDPDEGRRLAAEPGYWPVPQGLLDPLAKWNEWKPRVVHAVFSVQDKPFDDYDPEAPSPLFKATSSIRPRGRRASPRILR